MADVERIDRATEDQLIATVKMAAENTAAGDPPSDAVVKAMQSTGINQKFAKAICDAYNKNKTLAVFATQDQNERSEPFDIVDSGAVDLKLKMASYDIVDGDEDLPEDMPAYSEPVVKEAAPIKSRYVADMEELKVFPAIEGIKKKWASFNAGWHDIVRGWEHKKEQLVQKAASIARSPIGVPNEVYENIADSVSGGPAFLADLAKVAKIKCDYEKQAGALQMDHQLVKLAAEWDTVDKLHSAGAVLKQLFTECSDNISVLEKQASGLGAIPLTFATGGLTGATRALSSLADDVMGAKQIADAAGLESPGKTLSVPFLRTNADLDRLMNLSDIGSDPKLKFYSPADLADSYMSVVKQFPQLEKSRNLEMLKASIHKYLAQNGRLDLADIGAISKGITELNKNMASDMSAAQVPDTRGELTEIPKSQFLSAQGMSPVMQALNSVFPGKKDKKEEKEKETGKGTNYDVSRQNSRDSKQIAGENQKQVDSKRPEQKAVGSDGSTKQIGTAKSNISESDADEAMEDARQEKKEEEAK